MDILIGTNTIIKVNIRNRKKANDTVKASKSLGVVLSPASGKDMDKS